MTSYANMDSRVNSLVDTVTHWQNIDPDGYLPSINDMHGVLPDQGDEKTKLSRHLHDLGSSLTTVYFKISEISFWCRGHLLLACLF